MFSNPVFVFLGAGLFLLVTMGLASHARRRRRLAELLGGKRAARRLSDSNLYRLRIERMILLGLGAAALALAAAEPRAQPDAPAPAPPAPVRSVVVALDISASMQATDVPPTRLARALRIVDQLSARLEGDRMGLLLFATKGYVLAPPTRDHRTLSYLLKGMTSTTASAYDPGTLISVGIREAMSFLPPNEPNSERAIVLIGDGETGESQDAAVAAARAAVRDGIVIHTIGVGTAEGGTMILPDATYRKGGRVVDSTGRAAISRLREPLLRRIAKVGGGFYARASRVNRLRDIPEVFPPHPHPQAQPGVAPPVWTRVDLVLWLVVVALACLLLESLLDVRLPRVMLAARRVA